jgi:hypothetical protein
MTVTLTDQEGLCPKPPLGWDYEGWATDQKGRIYHLKYGRYWEQWLDVNITQIELKCFLEEWTEEQGGLGKYQHGVNAVNLIWNQDPKRPCFVWTPECVKMMQEACANKYLGICGAASCGKSHFAAMWALLCFYAAPHETMVLVTSTSLTAAKQRIWGSVGSLYSHMPEWLRNKAKMVGSNGILRYKEVDESKAQTDTRGITLVAAEQKNDKEAVAKLIGRKQRRMILCCDELPEISPSVVTAAKGNLATNPFFQFIALGNPKSYLDAFGTFCKPLAGWDSVTEHSYEWPIRSGKVIRFDATRSTNYTTGKWTYEFMPSRETIDEARAEFGEQSLTFYRMYRGYFPPMGSSDSIFPALELALHVQPKVAWGKAGFTKVAGLDVSFTSGGDKTVLTILRVGKNVDGLTMIEYQDAFLIQENILAKEETRTIQICSRAKEILDRESVEYRLLGYDSTGGGAPFGDVLSLVMKTREILPIQFAERASERIGAGTDRRPAHERYSNKVSEIYWQVSPFLRGRQLSNLPDELMNELSLRNYTTGQRGRITIQPKSEVKAVTGSSPDRSDSFVLAFEVACARLHIASKERGDFILPDKDYNKACQELDIVTLSSNGLPDWMPMAS